MSALIMSMLTPSQQAREAILAAARAVVEQFGVWLELHDGDELTYRWKIGIGEGERWRAINWWVMRRFIPRDAQPLALCYRHPTYPRRLLVSHDALDRIADGEVYLGNLLATAIRQSAALMHPVGMTDPVPVCVITVLRPAGATADSPGTLEYIADHEPPDTTTSGGAS